MLKGVDSVDKLPLNFNILYEVVTQDPLLASVSYERCLDRDLDNSQDDEVAPYLCQEHDQRIKHFYCSEHPSIFCRECIKDIHNTEQCFVVDLYEIEKMRKLQETNMQFNNKQIKARGGDCSQVHHMPLPKFKNPFGDQVKKELFSRRKPAVAQRELDPRQVALDQTPSSSAHETDPDLNTDEKARLKRELLMMGYDEDSYGQQEYGAE